MNKMSKESIQLTDKELAGASGGMRRVEMPPTTIVIFTEGSTIHGKPKK
jgi:hypothetical protein